MTPKDKIEKIKATIKAGNTIQISTAYRSTVVDQKVIDKFDKAGYPFFKATRRNMFMMQGKAYVCIDYCRITYQHGDH